MPLTSRERVPAILDHEIPDRVPIISEVVFRTGCDVFPLIPDFIELGVDILNPSVHTIMPDVPPENVLAMVDAAIEFGNYD